MALPAEQNSGRLQVVTVEVVQSAAVYVMVFPLPPVQEYEGVQAAVQEAAAYEPERVPFEQERSSEIEEQVTPSGATADWYAVTLLPWETAEPPKVQSWLQDWYW